MTSTITNESKYKFVSFLEELNFDIDKMVEENKLQKIRPLKLLSSFYRGNVIITSSLKIIRAGGNYDSKLNYYILEDDYNSFKYLSKNRLNELFKKESFYKFVDFRQTMKESLSINFGFKMLCKKDLNMVLNFFNENNLKNMEDFINYINKTLNISDTERCIKTSHMFSNTYFITDNLFIYKYNSFNKNYSMLSNDEIVDIKIENFPDNKTTKKYSLLSVYNIIINIDIKNKIIIKNDIDNNLLFNEFDPLKEISKENKIVVLNKVKLLYSNSLEEAGKRLIESDNFKVTHFFNISNKLNKNQTISLFNEIKDYCLNKNINFEFDIRDINNYYSDESKLDVVKCELSWL